MKLHLGCGPRFIPGYVHIDVIEYPHINIVSSVDRLPMIENESCDVVYSCHVLEHFHKKVVPDVLREWLRVLKVNGTLRIAVPDMKSLFKVYEKTGNLSLILGPIFGRCNYLYNFHYTGFDFTTLKDVLEQVGAKDVRLYDWKLTEHAEIDDYSQAYIPMDKINGTLISLNVEATK